MSIHEIKIDSIFSTITGYMKIFLHIKKLKSCSALKFVRFGQGGKRNYYHQCNGTLISFSRPIKLIRKLYFKLNFAHGHKFRWGASASHNIFLFWIIQSFIFLNTPKFYILEFIFHVNSSSSVEVFCLWGKHFVYLKQ